MLNFRGGTQKMGNFVPKKLEISLQGNFVSHHKAILFPKKIEISPQGNICFRPHLERANSLSLIKISLHTHSGKQRHLYKEDKKNKKGDRNIKHLLNPIKL